MINTYLEQAIGALRGIIELTKQDIENIKLAKHDEVAAHTEQKNKLLSLFEKNKKALDNELLKLAQSNTGANLADLLGDDTRAKLGELREVLLELKDKNRDYAKNVVVIKEFFDSLVGSMLGKPTQNTYTSKAIAENKDDIFKARV